MIAQSQSEPMRVVRLNEPEHALDGVIVIHSTALGPGAGGCRLWTYSDDDLMMADARRLAEGMTYKNALADLPFGGAKAVLRRPAGSYDRPALFRAFGRAVAALNGSYVTAEDVGTTVADMEAAAESTRHVAGLGVLPGRAGGDPSPWTALGVFEAMRAAARHALDADLSDLTVAVQGAGNVGSALCQLLAEAGTRLVVADVSQERCDRLAATYGARVIGIGEILGAHVDVLAPCALGGVLTEASVPALRARMVCGGANNQLANAGAAAMLVKRGIAYVPDYVANAGGIINVSAEYLEESAEQVEARVRQIAPRVVAILQEAADNGVSPAVVANQMAKQRISAAAAIAPG